MADLGMWKRALKVAAIVIAVTLGGSILFGPQIIKYVQHKYYRDIYRPEEIDTGSIENFPSSYRLKGVPWISYRKAYCQSAALRMIARKHGIKEDIGYFNFLMGFTYGAVYRAGMNVFMPYTDPVPGFVAAAPYLGLKMRCLTTDSRDLFLKAVRFYVSRGYPVAVELDAAKLWKEEGITPHIEVLVGYDEKGLEYFETGKENRFKMWARGLRVNDDALVEAVTSMTKTFITPWKFSLLIFEKEGKRKDVLEKVWSRNGKSLVGSKRGALSLGSRAVKQFASKMKKTGKVEYPGLLKSSVYSRRDNADFLRVYFRGDKEAEKAADLFREAAVRYEKVLNMVKDGAVDEEKRGEASDLLLNAASLEKEAGEIFLKKGRAGKK